IYTENWGSGLGNWNVVAGTPATQTNHLYNYSGDLYSPTRLLYAGSLPNNTHDYSVQAAIGCSLANSNSFLYLRASTSGDGYKLSANNPYYSDGDGNFAGF